MARSDELRRAVTAAARGSLLLAIDDAIALPPGTLPKTSSGKLQRTKLRTRYESGALATTARHGAPRA
jgi:fatty-acyl-CoA synthase